MKVETDASVRSTLGSYYRALYRAFGPQGWWPGRTRFEVITGAVLTQNTNWGNVEKAIRNLKREKLLTPEAMHGVSLKKLSALIRPAGYFNIKAGRLRGFTSHLFRYHDGSLARLFSAETTPLRDELLQVHGIGPETADSILLYAGRRPSFVVDAYTGRVLSRHAVVSEDATYDEMRSLFMDNLPHDTITFNEYHALIVKVGKEFCRPREPRCEECPLGRFL